MKLLMVNPTLGTGGAEIFTLNLATVLQKRGIDVSVLCLYRQTAETSLLERYKHLNIYFLQSIPFLSAVAKLDVYLLRSHIDFSFIEAHQHRVTNKSFLKSFTHIHSNLIEADLYVAQFHGKHRFKHVTTVHGDYSAEYVLKNLPDRHYLNFDKKLLKIKSSVDMWVVISDEQENFFKKTLRWEDLSIRKIYNGWTAPPSTSKLHNKSNKPFTIGMISRGEPEKGWQILINAFLKVAFPAQLILIGDSSYLTGLREKYKHHNNIEFTGYKLQPLELLKSFDLFVLPTLFPFESLPTVIIEALYCSVPVIATDVGEIKNMLTLENGERAGILLERADATCMTNELLHQLSLLYQHKDLRDKLAANATIAFRKFDIETCANRYIDVYNY